MAPITVVAMLALASATPAGEMPYLPTGRVLDVCRNFCEISLGADDGIFKRLQLGVYRDGRCVRRVIVRAVAAKRCVGEAIPGWPKGEVRIGDRVQTGLRWHLGQIREDPGSGSDK